jgi:Viral BACON domain/Putative binding domain, N-terminal
VKRIRHPRADFAVATGAAVLLLGSAAACGSSAKTSVGPSEFLRCAVEASAAPAAFPPDGGSGRLTISTDRDCGWSAASGASWITLASTSGQGAATVDFSVAANADPVTRSASFTVSSRQVAVTQQPAVCRFQLSATGGNLPSAGGSMAIDVAANSALCEWRARSEADWIVVREGSTGRGNGRVVVEAGPSGGPTRSGTLVVADVPVTITQGDGCGYAIAPLNQSVGASGGSGTITITTGQGCAWTAASQAPWISITSGASGAGNGTVAFTVAAHSGPPRTAAITVAGHNFSVTQQSGCSVTLSANNQSFAAAGGQGAVRVDSSGGCQWQAVSNAAWISIQSGTSGTGGGEVRFQVAPNTGAARNGTIAIGGQAFTVNQEAVSCSFALSATGANIPAGGGGGAVGVTAPASCAWNAASDPAATWLRITAGASGSGDGKVDFVVDPNTGPARSTTLMVAGQAFTVQQAGGCSISIAPMRQAIASGGGGGTITVNASAGCAWNATTADGWISITAGSSGSGPGSVEFTVAPNTGAARTGVISIAGQQFTVDQAAACAFSIAPTAQTFDTAGGTGTIAVTTTDGCGWTATSADPWITITPPAGGSGSGSVTFTVAANSGAARGATLTVAGQPFSVTQMGTMLVLESLIVRGTPTVPIVQRPRT